MRSGSGMICGIRGSKSFATLCTPTYAAIRAAAASMVSAVPPRRRSSALQRRGRGLAVHVGVKAHDHPGPGTFVHSLLAAAPPGPGSLALARRASRRPRWRGVDVYLSLQDVLQREYPLSGRSIEDVLDAGDFFGHLIDYGVMMPRAQAPLRLRRRRSRAAAPAHLHRRRQSGLRLRPRRRRRLAGPQVPSADRARAAYRPAPLSPDPTGQSTFDPQARLVLRPQG